MDPSLHEQYLARAWVVLLAAGTMAGTRVSRGRPDAWASAETPALNVRRSDGQLSEFGSGVDLAVLEFDLDLIALETPQQSWETLCDALHTQAHAALLADATLALMGKGLRCMRTRCSAESGDQILGRITATYQVQNLVRRADLTLAPT